MAWMENADVENRSFEMQGVSAEGCNMHLVGVLEEDDVSQSPRMQQTVANFGNHQDSSPFIDFQDDEMDFGELDLLDDPLVTRVAATLRDVFASVWLFIPRYA
ncbi:unnamed protein product [Sphagnum balticum]